MTSRCTMLRSFCRMFRLLFPGEWWQSWAARTCSLFTDWKERWQCQQILWQLTKEKLLLALDLCLSCHFEKCSMLNTNKHQFTNQYARREPKCAIIEFSSRIFFFLSKMQGSRRLPALFYSVIFILGSQLHKIMVQLFLKYYFPVVFKENMSVIYSAPEPDKYFPEWNSRKPLTLES